MLNLVLSRQSQQLQDGRLRIQQFGSEHEARPTSMDNGMSQRNIPHPYNAKGMPILDSLRLTQCI